MAVARRIHSALDSDRSSAPTEIGGVSAPLERAQHVLAMGRITPIITRLGQRLKEMFLLKLRIN